jgi:hypothetical protein
VHLKKQHQASEELCAEPDCIQRTTLHYSSSNEWMNCKEPEYDADQELSSDSSPGLRVFATLGQTIFRSFEDCATSALRGVTISAAIVSLRFLLVF